MPQPDTWYLNIPSLYQSAQLKRKTGLKQYKQLKYLELKGITVTLNMKISIVCPCLMLGLCAWKSQHAVKNRTEHFFPIKINYNTQQSGCWKSCQLLVKTLTWVLVIFVESLVTKISLEMSTHEMLNKDHLHVQGQNQIWRFNLPYTFMSVTTRLSWNSL